MRGWGLVLFFLGVLFVSKTALAIDNCSSGGGSGLGNCSVSGRWDWDTTYLTYKFCDGTNWVSVEGSGTLGSCTNTAALEWDSGTTNYKYCDGSNWIPAGNNGTLGSCSSVAKRDYDTTNNVMSFCDGTNWIDMTGTQPVQSSKCVFVSSTTYKGNGFGGVSGADSVCTSLAQSAGLGGSTTYKAWLSDSVSTNSPGDRFVHHTGPYKLVNGDIVADDWADLTDNFINAVIKQVSSIVNSSYFGGSWGVEVYGDYAFVAAWSSNKLVSVDISDPLNPFVADSVGRGSAQGIALSSSGNYAYVTTGNTSVGGLYVYDISDPTSIIYKGGVSNITTMEWASNVAVSGNYAYLTSASTDHFVVIDVSDPANPVEKTNLTGATFKQPRSIKILGNYAFVLNYDGGALISIDISDPLNPSVADTVNTSGGWSTGIAFDKTNTYAFVDDDVVNISNPTAMSLVGSTGIIGWGHDVSGDILIANSGHKYDVSDPASPVLLGNDPFDTINSSRNVRIIGNYAFLPDSGEFLVFDINTGESAIIRDENGNLVSGFDNVWTGVDNDGTNYPIAGYTCNDWTSGGGGASSVPGDTVQSNAWSNSANGVACTASNHIYCFQQ